MQTTSSGSPIPRICWLLVAAGCWALLLLPASAQPATQEAPAETAPAETAPAETAPTETPSTETPPIGAAEETAPAAENSKATKEDGKRKTEEHAAGTKWVRVEYDEQGKPKSLQTAVVRYKPKGTAEGEKSLEVDLVGAIHVGDATYYEDLNQRFDAYDALLYELVAPEGTRIERGTKASSRHALGAMQNGMKDMLALEHQLELIDYTKENFVHADMTPDEFLKAMEERKESLFSMYMRLVGQSIAAQNKNPGQRQTSDVDFLSAYFSKDRPRRLKIAMAKQFSDMEELLTSLGGKKGNTLIHGRNIKALEVLRREIDGGKQKLGVFYGAGHLADMHERLVEEFGLEPTEITWLTAWDLTDKQPEGKAKEAKATEKATEKAES